MPFCYKKKVFIIKKLIIQTHEYFSAFSDIYFSNFSIRDESNSKGKDIFLSKQSFARLAKGN